MRLPIWQRAAKTPWAITEDQLDNILTIAKRDNLSPEAVAQQMGQKLENTYSVEYRDGVAILSVTGPLFRYANLFTAVSGATSYDRLAKDFHAAINDSRVNAVLLNIDSPGGEANGCAELAQQIYDARGQKPITAYVGGQGASGAYWIASAADRVVANQTALLGSIGVRTALIDDSQWMEEQGLREYVIVSSQSPNKDIDPAEESDRARVQAVVDDLAAVFVSNVATYRGVSEEKVLNDYGQGDVMVGQKAVSAGLADRLGDFEAVLADLAGDGANDIFANVAAAPWTGHATREKWDMKTSNFATALNSAIDAAVSDSCSREQVLQSMAEATGLDREHLDAIVAGERAPDSAAAKAITAATGNENVVASLLQAARADGLESEAESEDDETDEGTEGDSEALESKRTQISGASIGRAEAASIISICSEAGVPEMAAKLIEQGASAEDAKARATSAGHIRDLCTAAGVPSRADQFIEQAVPVHDVKNQLFDDIVGKSNQKIVAHVPPDSAPQGAAPSAGAKDWADAYANA